MVDDFEEKRIQDFMYHGMDAANEALPQLESAFTYQQQSSSLQNPSGTTSTNEVVSELMSETGSVTNSTQERNTQSSRLRQMSHHVKSMLNEAKQALQLDSDEDIKTMTINEEVTVIEWAPAVFHAIKSMDGITAQMI